jgi:hypothetical protein
LSGDGGCRCHDGGGLWGGLCTDRIAGAEGSACGRGWRHLRCVIGVERGGDAVLAAITGGLVVGVDEVVAGRGESGIGVLAAQVAPGDEFVAGGGGQRVPVRGAGFEAVLVEEATSAGCRPYP